jgi:hypothetical protein
MLYSYLESLLWPFKTPNVFFIAEEYILTIVLYFQGNTHSIETWTASRWLVGTPEGRRPLGRPRRRWLDNIRPVLVEVGWGDVDWICLAQDRDR